jgi:hypothetical protein
MLIYHVHEEGLCVRLPLQSRRIGHRQPHQDGRHVLEANSQAFCSPQQLRIPTRQCILAGGVPRQVYPPFHSTLQGVHDLGHSPLNQDE